MKKIISLCLLLSLQFACNHTKESESKDIREAPANEKITENNNPFFAYNFGGLQDYSPSEQIEMLKGYGYDGITLRMAKKEDVEELNEFLELASGTENFEIYSVFVRYNFDQSEEDRNRWKEVVNMISGKGIDLWFIFGKPIDGVNDEQVEGILRNVVTYADSKNVTVTLYPHSWCYFDTAEKSLPMVKKIDHPNLKLALHTCHELKAGNGERMAEVVDNVKDYLSFVTIAGAAKEIDMSSRKLMDATSIQPLEDGEYVFAPFLKALKDAGFKGPVGYINFKFDKQPEEYLPESLAEWERLKNLYLNY